MKKHYLFIGLIACLGLVLFTNAFTNVKASSCNEIKAESNSVVYILSDYHGRIAVFRNDSAIPIRVFDVFTNSLPLVDKELIENGIQVNYSQLPQVIEEYIS